MDFSFQVMHHMAAWCLLRLLCLCYFLLFSAVFAVASVKTRDQKPKVGDRPCAATRHLEGCTRCSQNARAPCLQHKILPKRSHKTHTEQYKTDTTHKPTQTNYLLFMRKRWEFLPIRRTTLYINILTYTDIKKKYMEIYRNIHNDFGKKR